MVDTETLQQQILKSVGQYLNAGLNVMPLRVDGTKAPKIGWRAWQVEPVPRHLLREHFVTARQPSGIGVICGVTSGNLEILDFDQPDIFKPWCRAMVRFRGGILNGVFAYAPLVETPSGGRHLYYRTPAVGPSEKLAYRGGKIAIETRGQGGQAVMPGGPPGTHHTGRPYRLLGGSWAKIPVISPAQREALFAVSREFDDSPPKPEPTPRPLATPAPWSGACALTPWDDFNRRAEWFDVLGPAEWTEAGEHGQVTYWKRPGKTGPGISASTGFCGDLLHVFSSNAHPLEGGKTYSKFQAFTHLYVKGDFREATRMLAASGFGVDHTEDKIREIIKGQP